MGIVYYKIPLELKAVMKGHELPICDLEQSIAKNLELIIMTRFGEHRNDPTFGCKIWDKDFELIVKPGEWEEELRKSLIKSIAEHEDRLVAVEITVTITEMEKFNVYKNFTEIKKRVDIFISGTIHKTGEYFPFRTNMFLSPLSVD